MKDYYSILNISRNSTQDEIVSSYLRVSVLRSDIGDNDYDNMRKLVQLGEYKEAHTVLANRCNRLRYDIRRFGQINYLDINIKSEEEKSKLLNAINEEISVLNSTIKTKYDTIENLNKKVQTLITKSIEVETDHKIAIELEKGKNHDLQNVINDLLIQIEAIKDEISSLQSIEKDRDIAIKEKHVTERQNSRLLLIARNHRNFIFKIITIISFFFIFILLIFYLNL